ncbi:MarR family winged helix-turn-helix transcriptional regulator [Bacillus sp. RAR_GA_16]|uniref:MarR family winged helix-turn-helix transcriptional regulator n=1 Tax=Bacillus sp. RAR_GA_16 TaxID=2876774 RepID=UPI001CCEE4AC|nr:MarR family transcriptional regulator [Bacillus sp. RAR_GA_16]MCA0174532.1 MarR family transcriptional regulator [Bacillus sp. RAR_GA_16]
MEDKLHYLLNNFRAMYKVLENDWERSAQNMGITKAEQHLLWIVYSEKEVTVSRLSDLCLLKVSTVMQVLKRMEEKGLISQIKRQEDRRVTYVSMTTLGYETINTSTTFEYQFLEYFHEMDESKRNQMLDCVQDLNRHFYGDAFVQWVEKNDPKTSPLSK